MAVLGRPPKYKTPEELSEKAIQYFEQFTDPANDEKIRLGGLRPTITGLVLHLGFCDRQSFYDYMQRPDFSCTIKILRTMIEQEYENRLAGANVTGIIFALKNLGWTDKQEIEHRGINITYGYRTTERDASSVRGEEQGAESPESDSEENT